jgi:hypothetical protein
MNVFTLEADANKYQNLVLVNEDDWEVIYKFNGTPIGPSWQPLKVEVLYDEDHSINRPASDFPSFAPHIPVLSQRALKVLGPVLRDNGELLQLSCKDGKYVAFNVTRTLDILDVVKSDIVYFSSGKILDVKRFVFNSEPSAVIFKLNQMPLGKVFVTDSFVRTVQEAGLEGFAFQLVWSAPKSS